MNKLPFPKKNDGTNENNMRGAYDGMNVQNTGAYVDGVNTKPINSSEDNKTLDLQNYLNNRYGNTEQPKQEVPQTPQYVQSQSVTDAYNYLESVMNNKPSSFTSSYSGALKDMYDAIVNKEKFSYDVANDALYQQYARQYAQMGNKAMQDTMGNAAALTGGYGSSYASTAGQQAYNGYLGQLNSVVPELYQSAYGRYRDDVNDMYNQYGLLSDAYDREYNAYRDSVNDYNNNLKYAYDRYSDTLADDYKRYLNEVNQKSGISDTQRRQIEQDAIKNYLASADYTGARDKELLDAKLGALYDAGNMSGIISMLVDKFGDNPTKIKSYAEEVGINITNQDLKDFEEESMNPVQRVINKAGQLVQNAKNRK